jgi:FlaA1/EpsC-like NDP-sugar epimerase
MATPDYLQQVIVSARARAVRDRRTYSTRFGLFRRPSMTSIVWASLDLVTIFIAMMLALRVRIVLPPQVHVLYVVPDLIEASPRTLFLYVGWFAACLIFFVRSYGMYGPIQNRSGLHEQRMTVQASLMAGLLLCGALYLFNGVAISRIVVALVVLFSAVLLCARRAVSRRMAYKRFREGMETRNVLIVGAGRVGTPCGTIWSR